MNPRNNLCIIGLIRARQIIVTWSHPINRAYVHPKATLVTVGPIVEPERVIVKISIQVTRFPGLTSYYTAAGCNDISWNDGLTQGAITTTAWPYSVLCYVQK